MSEQTGGASWRADIHRTLSERSSSAEGSPDGASCGRAGEGEERGSATVWMLGICVLLLVLCGWLGQFALVQNLAQRARTASDLSALAAADAVRGRTEAEPCQAAASVAAANRAEVEQCGIEGEFATITCIVRAGPFEASRTAKAGPPREAGLSSAPPSPSESR